MGFLFVFSTFQNFLSLLLFTFSRKQFLRGQLHDFFFIILDNYFFLYIAFAFGKQSNCNLVA